MKKLIKVKITPLLGRELLEGSRTFVVVVSDNTSSIQKDDIIKFQPVMVDTSNLKSAEVDKLRESLKDMPINNVFFKVTYVFTSAVMKENCVILGVTELPMCERVDNYFDTTKGGETYEVYGQ